MSPIITPLEITGTTPRQSRPRNARAKNTKLVGTPKPRRQRPEPRDLGVMAQIEAATARPAALAVGAILGGFVPAASYHLAHFEAAARPWLWLLIAAALLFSGLSVYDWTTRAFHSRAKAIGFVVLTEGIMLWTQSPILAQCALAVLVAINAAATGARLATEKGR